jgi:hypothetical protein
MFRERDQLIIHYRAVRRDFDRFVMMRFVEPTRSDVGEIFGIWQSLDGNGAVAAGLVMWARSPVPGDVIRHIRTHFQVSWKFGFMSVMRDEDSGPSIGDDQGPDGSESW